MLDCTTALVWLSDDDVILDAKAHTVHAGFNSAVRKSSDLATNSPAHKFSWSPPDHQAGLGKKVNTPDDHDTISESIMNIESLLCRN